LRRFVGRVDQTSNLSDLSAAGSANLSEQIRIDSFQSSKRSDNYGIASFVISNVSDKALNPIELTCWL
jgi:hypothetical protein